MKNKLYSEIRKELAQLVAVVQSLSLHPTLCDTMDCSTPGFPVPHYLLEFVHTHIHWVMLPSSHLILCTLFCYPQSFLASGSFSVSQLFTSGGQGIGASASAPVLQMNIQGWFSLGLTSLISLLSKGPSRDFSSTTVRKHQFFCPQPSLWSKSHIHTWLLEKP